MKLSLQYEREGIRAGQTVAEWESRRRLPPYSVYPEAVEARRFPEKGFFMYRSATDEERAEMSKSRGGARWRS